MREPETTRREEEEVRRLLEEAGPRPSIPEDDLAAITEAARAVWLRRYGDRKAPARSRWWVGLAAAAALAVAIGLAWWLKIPEPPPARPQVASIEILTGAVRMWKPTGEGPIPLSTGALGRPLPAGAELETEGEGGGMGRLALRMAGGASVRLDAGTRVRLVSTQSVELDRGAVYVDSGARPGGMSIRSAAGLFQDVGTQFEVRIEGKGAQAATRLRVREGRVVLDQGKRPILTKAGEELTVHADGHIARRPVAVYGPEWDWVLQTAPKFDIEGMKVRAFLDWLARETGWHIEFADQEASSRADSTVLHGSIEHLAPTEAPGAVLASCGLGYRNSGGRMVVFVAEEGR
jgi:ferric-dicitrate binding protein FerR (iron transport regulator)